MLTVLLIIGIGIAGYFAYRYLQNAFDVPAELERFENEDSVRTMLRSTARVPADATLDSAWIALYVDGMTASGAALISVHELLDSMHRAGAATGDTGITSILTSPSFYRAVSVVEPSTKRALIAFLNAHGRSLDEYRWAKEHTIAATDITRSVADSALNALIGPHFTKGKGTKLSFAGNNTEEFFERVDSIRSSGAITVDVHARAMQSRAIMLRLGLGSLFGLDTDFDAHDSED